MSFINIYTYIEHNFNIKITDYQFKRDYIQDPLKKIVNNKHNEYEIPDKEDLTYLYIKLNLSLEPYFLSFVSFFIKHFILNQFSFFVNIFSIQF